MRHEPSSGYDDPAVNYRVTWKNFGEGGEVHERILTDRDQAWDFYQDKQRSSRSYAATWDHVPARES